MYKQPSTELCHGINTAFACLQHYAVLRGEEYLTMRFLVVQQHGHWDILVKTADNKVQS